MQAPPGCYVESTLKSTDRSRTSKTKFSDIEAFCDLIWFFVTKSEMQVRQTTELKIMNTIKTKVETKQKQKNGTTEKKKSMTTKPRKQRSMTHLQARKDMKKKGDHKETKWQQNRQPRDNKLVLFAHFCPPFGLQ